MNLNKIHAFFMHLCSVTLSIIRTFAATIYFINKF